MSREDEFCRALQSNYESTCAPRLRFIHEFRRPGHHRGYNASERRTKRQRIERIERQKIEERKRNRTGGGRVKGRNAFPRPEIAVSILAFINTSVAALKVLASSVSTRTNEKPTMKGRGAGGGCGNTRSVINLDQQRLIDRISLYRARLEQKEEKEPIYSAIYSDGSARQIRAGRSLSFVRN